MSKGILDLLLMAMQTIALTIGLVAIVGFAVYLIGVAWLCFSETRQGGRDAERIHAFDRRNYRRLMKRRTNNEQTY